MSTKIKGEKIKEGSIALNALNSGNNLLLGLMGSDIRRVSLLEDNKNYTLSSMISVCYIETPRDQGLLELPKYSTLTFKYGPGAEIIWDDNGIRITNGASFYSAIAHEVLVPISPDWNALENERGYIKNRTHYTTIEDHITITDADIDSTYTFIFESNHNFFYKTEDSATREIKLPIASDTINNVKDGDWTDISAYGPPLQVVRTLEGVFIRNKYGYAANRNLYFWKELVHTLNEKYIPDIIARQSDITIDWNAEVDEEKYIKNRTHGLKYKSTYTLGEGVTEIPHDNVYFAYFNNRIIELPDFSDGLEISIISSPHIYIKYVFKDHHNVIELIDNFNFFNNNIIEFYRQIDTLNPLYLPDEIARTKNYELHHITFYQYLETDNLKLLSSLTPGYRYTCDLYSTRKHNDSFILENGEYFNGIITGIEAGKLIQYDVNFETGAITKKLNIDLELIGSEVKLDVCTAGSQEAARNLELLNAAYFSLGDHFTVNIDAGIGVAKFIPETGGEGHITTASGVNVHYNIGTDGSVVKTMEIDIVELYNKVNSL